MTAAQLSDDPGDSENASTLASSQVPSQKPSKSRRASFPHIKTLVEGGEQSAAGQQRHSTPAAGSSEPPASSHPTDSDDSKKALRKKSKSPNKNQPLVPSRSLRIHNLKQVSGGTQLRPIYIDLSDSSDVWQRKPTRERLSLKSIKPPSLKPNGGIPWIAKLFSGGSDKEQHKPKKKQRSSNRRHHGHHSSRRRTKAVEYVPMPEAHPTGQTNADGSRETTIQFVQSPETTPPSWPMPAPYVPPAHAIHDPCLTGTPKMSMPIPKHILLEEIARAPTNAILQLSQIGRRRSQHRKSQHRDDSLLSSLNGKLRRSSTASGEEDPQQLRIYRVLGRKGKNNSIHARVNSDIQLSPVLVTIARDGSIVSSESPRPSEELPPCSSGYHPARTPSPIRQPVTESISPPVAEATDELGIGPSVEHSPKPETGTDTATGATSTTSPGATESFATARLFTDTLSPEPVRGLTDQDASAKPESHSSDEVSEIAMRRYLATSSRKSSNISYLSDIVEDDLSKKATDTVPHTAAISMDSEDNSAADQAFSDWLKAQAAVNDRPEVQSLPVTASIAQTVYSQTEQQAIRNDIAYLKTHGLNALNQRRYSPTAAASMGIPPPSFTRAVGSDQMGLLEGLLARVSELESRFTCVEALMDSFNDKMDNLLAASLAPNHACTSMSIGNASVESVATAAKMPMVIKNVNRNPR
ncbi:hypothetical protein GGI07_002143 [Coemansia sp. Benny D115]|nr:hypothetical protein GGI07_002143 [Coemansia sp. Benny D115]